MCMVQKIQVCDKTFTEEVGFFERISSTLRSLALSVKSYGVLALRFVERVGNPNPNVFIQHHKGIHRFGIPICFIATISRWRVI